MSRRALVLLSVMLTLLVQLASGERAHAQLIPRDAPVAAPATATPSAAPGSPAPSPASPAPSPASPAPSPASPASPAPSPASPIAPPETPPAAPRVVPALTREETAKLTAQIVAGRRASKRAASYTKRGRDRRARLEWQRAIDAYTAAFERSGDPELRLPLALAEEGRGELVAAAHQLRFLLQTPGVRTEVTTVAAVRLESLYQRLARVTFAVTPARTVVYRGISVVTSTPMTGPLLLAPGVYTFRFEANGFRSKEVTVEVAAGDDRRREVDLFPLAPLMPPIERDPQLASEASSRRPTSRVVLAGAAVTTALVVAAGTTGGLALYRHGQVDDEKQQARRRRLADSGERFALATDVLVGAAVLTAAATAYYYFAVDAPRAESAARAARAAAGPSRSARGRPAAALSLRVTPWASADSAGIGLSGAL